MKKKMTSAEKEAAGDYRRMLREKRDKLVAGLGTKFDTLARMGRVAEEDQAQITHDEFVSLRMNSLDFVQLRLVDEALNRLDSRDYGVCLACEAPIPAKRLQALPWARYCVTCQEKIGHFEENEILESRPRGLPR